MTSDSGWEQELRQRLEEIFMGEAGERLDALQAAARAMEDGAAGDDAERHLGEAFRHAHTLKGGARAVDRPEVERVAHALESLFDRLRSGAPPGPGTWAAVSAGVDAIRARLAGRPVDVDTVVSAITAAAPTG